MTCWLRTYHTLKQSTVCDWPQEPHLEGLTIPPKLNGKAYFLSFVPLINSFVCNPTAEMSLMSILQQVQSLLEGNFFLVWLEARKHFSKAIKYSAAFCLL